MSVHTHKTLYSKNIRWLVIQVYQLSVYTDFTPCNKYSKNRRSLGLRDHSLLNWSWLTNKFSKKETRLLTRVTLTLNFLSLISTGSTIQICYRYKIRQWTWIFLMMLRCWSIEVLMCLFTSVWVSFVWGTWLNANFFGKMFTFKLCLSTEQRDWEQYICSQISET